MSRKEFLSAIGKGGTCSCLCAMFCAADLASASEPPTDTPSSPPDRRIKKRMEFVDQWVPRFFGVMDETLDEADRKKLMMANGKVCHREYLKSIGRKITPVPFEKWAEAVKQRVTDGSFRVEGRVVYFQYMSSAETGLPAAEGACLCPLVETKPAGLSGTYCLCSLGYVKDLFEQTLGTKVDIELVDSVLKGGKRCKFKITVP
ncbi:MAG TPA: DUF6144 family protein [Phycisphaerae bacterium]|nr:DUF6144 family protein [Phycisphaerae bacterium]